MRWFPVAFLTNGVYQCDTWRNRTENPCVVCESAWLTTAPILSKCEELNDKPVQERLLQYANRSLLQANPIGP